MVLPTFGNGKTASTPLDPDNDGVPNWLESRFGTSPTNSSPGLFLNVPQMLPPDKVALRFGPGGTNLVYSIWWTPVISQPWTILQTINSGTSPASSYQITHTNPPVSSAYYRLQVTPAPP